MRVLHVYNSHRRGGGSDNAWAATIRLSRRAGIEVEVLARSSGDIAPSMCGKIGAALSGIYSAGAATETRRAIERFRPDIVHTHELYPLWSPSVIRVADRMGVPVVHSCYDYRLTCPIATHFRAGAICRRCTEGREYAAILFNCRGSLSESIAYAARNAASRSLGLFARHVSEYFVLSPFHQAWLTADVGVPADRVTVVPCLIENPTQAADPACGAYIAYAGRFVPEKGVELLIEAARRTGLPVRLAGDAASHPAIRPGDPVHCVVTRSPEELAAFYRGARMLVVPSIWNETFCIVGAEAMSHGIPIVASRLGALQDLVDDGHTGLLFTAGDVQHLADQMLRLWHDPALARQLGAAARAHVARSYGAGVHIARLRAGYARAVARRGATVIPKCRSD